MELKSMKLAPRDKTSEEKMYPTMADSDDDRPKFPWGLCITLEDEQLKQLGITDIPKVDSAVTISAKADITGYNENQTQNGSRRSLTLQITDLAIE